MALRRPLVLIAGEQQELPVGDTLPGSTPPTRGTTTIEFGAWPGDGFAQRVVTGQAGIGAGSYARAWMRPQDTADHTADEHRVAPITLTVSDVVAGVGLTVSGYYSGTATTYGSWSIDWEWS